MEEQENNIPKEEKEKTEKEPVKKEEKKSSFNSKFLTIGLPVFVVEVLVVYFVTANILMKKFEGAKNISQEVTSKDFTPTQLENVEPSQLGKHIFTINDVIVNPEGTDGKRLLLVSVGFDLGKEKDQTEFKDKEVMVKDAIITVLSSKTLNQLSNVAYKDTIKINLINRVRQMMPDVQLNTVYLSKYIIQ